MGLRDAVCLAFIFALFIGCKGQGFFSVTATASGQSIALGITDNTGSATFQCQLDSQAFESCSDGFVYPSVAIGDHTITVRGTAQDGRTGEVALTLTVSPPFMITAVASILGTTITVTIDANQDATFECQLDDSSFVSCTSGFQYSGVSSGPHTIRVRGNSTESGQVVETNAGTVEIEVLAVDVTGITGTQDITAQTYTFSFETSEDFPVQCSIDGGAPVDCSSPYVIDTSTLSRGQHNITFSVIINNEVRGLATESFTALEEVFIEFQDLTYSVVEDEEIYNVTIVKRGEPGEDIQVLILPNPDPTSANSAAFISDYEEAGQITLVPGGPDEITTQLQVNADRIFENDETLLLSFSLTPAAIDSGARIGARNESRVTIINDDMVQVMFLQGSVDTTESERAFLSVGFTPQPTDIPFTFIVETFDFSPADAEAGVDYQPLRTNVTLNPLQVTANLAVDIIQDSITERTETFGVRIIVPEETQQLGVTAGDPSVIPIRITDDDPGNLEITCFTNVTEDERTGRTVTVFFDANQDATFRCRITGRPFEACTSPHVFTNVDLSETVRVEIEGTTTLLFTPQVATANKTVFFAMGGLQVVGAGAIAVHLEATKTATYRCRLNDGEYVDCDDGQVFQNLTAGTYTLFVEARATENTNEVAFDTVGPVVLAIGANATVSEAIAACFGRAPVRCSDANNQDCQYIATWRTRGDRVEFNIAAQTQGWVGIGFSLDRLMPRSDIIVGAASDTGFFVDDRYAEAQVEPPQDPIQNVVNPSASFVQGVTTVQFSRDKITGDSDRDLTLSVCRFLLYAWSGNADIDTGVIQYHGIQNRASSETLICFPSPSLCPERFDCGDPGAPDNGNSNFTDTREGSVVTYTCNSGFVLVGNRTQTCELTPNGALWSFTRPVCTPIDCGNPGTPQNGSTTVTSDTVGSMAEHFCDEGFNLQGVSQRECLVNGSWSDSLPTCVIVDCGDPGVPFNGNTMGTIVTVGSTDIRGLSTTFGSVVNHTCNPGFRLDGAFERVCLSNGNWSPPLPTCELVDCGDPGEPENGDTSVTTTTVGSLANHTCDDDFALNGASQRECLPDGNWSPDLPTCIPITCVNPGVPQNGNTFVISTTVGSIVNHTCNIGYNLIGADQRECLSNASWSEPLPMCVIVDCGDAGTPINGDTMQTTTTFGSIVNHTCNLGYALNGSSQRVCLESGEWSQPLPSCEISDCGDPGTPANGNTIGTTFTFGSIINHTCNEGYIIDGPSQRECLANQSWSGRLPDCVIIDCGDPGTPDNGTTSGDSTTFGSVVTHMCDVGFELNGEDERECILSDPSTGVWSEPLPSCDIIDCGDPGMPDNGDTTGNNTTFGSVVTHTCDDGYLLTGADERTCLESGNWSAPLPSCEITGCGDPGTPTNGDTIGSNFTFGSIINHTCNEGYIIDGPSQRQCLANQSWSGRLPDCVIIDCGDPGTPVNGTTSGDSTTFGSVVTHMCDVGFELNGADERECILSDPSTGVWSEPLPSCDIINCGDPGLPLNGVTVVSSTTFGSVVTHSCDDGYLLVGADERTCLESGNWSEPLPSCEMSAICRIDGQSVFPFGETGLQMAYLLRDICEHVVLTTCSGSETFSLNVDYSEESLNPARVGVQYDTTTIVVVIDDNFLTVNAQNLGSPISQSGQTTEYPNQIFITQASNEVIVDIRRIGVRLTVTLSDLQVEVSSGALSGDFCGLCGRLNGKLVHSDRTTVADITDNVDVQQFTDSWRAEDVFLRDVPRDICNATVKIRDPLFKIPIHIDQALIDANPALAEACLCYEVHGRDNSTFNLLSDRCTSVNARYTSMNNPVAGNIISAIGVTAIDRNGICHQIEANIDQCSVSVDGSPLAVGASYNNAGISVIRYQGRVKIAVPNCGRAELVLWFICKTVHNAITSEFIIARGVNLQPTSHGLVGQFWNIPIGVQDFVVDPYYTITVNPKGGTTRSFVSSLYERPWEIMLPCLFTGDRQGGETNAFGDPNDSVLHGSYQDYEVTDLFSTDFTFSTFDSAACGTKK